MKFQAVANAYKKTEMFGASENKDSRAILILVMEELIKSMRLFHTNISIKEGDVGLRSKNFSRALSVIYMLQSSLDLEKGDQIARDLFRMYEYARVNLITDLRNGVVKKSGTALSSIEEILSAWRALPNEG